VINVSAVEGSFSREDPMPFHPHTNMAKAGLNMLTRTAAAQLADKGVLVNSVDPGWVSLQQPRPDQPRQRGLPIDAVDGAARVLAPVFDSERGVQYQGLLLRHYKPAEW